MTGRLAHIWRHTIKSHGTEALGQVTLTRGCTMPWDRTWAVAHEQSGATGSEWVPCVNFSRGAKAPRLMAIRAELDEAAGRITLTHPDLPPLTLDPEREAQALLDWVGPLMPENRARSARLIRVDGRGMTDTDYPSVSVVNLASHAAVETAAGRPLDIRRWRGNFWLEGLAPWAETEWIGRILRLGEARLRLVEPIVRCRATMADPDSGQVDVDTLGILETARGGREFGLYAEVLEGGVCRTGDRVELL